MSGLPVRGAAEEDTPPLGSEREAVGDCVEVGRSPGTGDTTLDGCAEAMLCIYIFLRRG